MIAVEIQHDDSAVTVYYGVGVPFGLLTSTRCHVIKACIRGIFGGEVELLVVGSSATKQLSVVRGGGVRRSRRG